ncbi:MAG: metalloregulator ArsR/SmtB family transcription factor [Labilithrix sp.]|nr:metalloregulator ArsR/SmtB family transcription factor [Labilithrix sp.]MCW5814766.1 metalloregulator ArsR/SmtB family transcription factor [Labilithrix sp.]
MVATAAASTTRWELYRVLAEPVRLKLLALAAEEELAIGELAELLDESQPNVSRHVAPLKSAGLLLSRKQGTRALVRIAEAASADPVVADALASGRALCEGDGSLARVAEVLRERDRVGREFFAREQGGARSSERGAGLEPADASAAYIAALARLLPARKLAVDAGTGDGALLDVLAPAFEKVIAVDRSELQLERARARVAARGFVNVRLLKSELGAAELLEHVGDGADVVFASRFLHHAPRPVDLVTQLARLARPGAAVVVIDYARHDDESMRDEADLWLGFEPDELRRFAREAGLCDIDVIRLPAAWCGKGKDAHLPWQVLIGKRKDKP